MDFLSELGEANSVDFLNDLDVFVITGFAVPSGNHPATGLFWIKVLVIDEHRLAQECAERLLQFLAGPRIVVLIDPRTDRPHLGVDHPRLHLEVVNDGGVAPCIGRHKLPHAIIGQTA